MSMIDAFKNVSTKPKIYLMVPPPLYQDNRYGMNRECHPLSSCALGSILGSFPKKGIDLMLTVKIVFLDLWLLLWVRQRQ